MDVAEVQPRVMLFGQMEVKVFAGPAEILAHQPADEAHILALLFFLSRVVAQSCKRTDDYPEYDGPGNETDYDPETCLVNQLLPIPRIAHIDPFEFFADAVVIADAKIVDVRYAHQLGPAVIMGVLPEMGLVKHLDQSEHINEKKHKLKRYPYPIFCEYMKNLKLPALVVPNRFSYVVSGIADQKLRKKVQPIDPIAFVEILDQGAKEMYNKCHHDR